MDGDCDACDTIDGRWMNAIAEYAQTCDGCANLTMNENLTMDQNTHLSYCRKCERQRDGHSLYCHGWYSVENDKSLGHFYCTLTRSGPSINVSAIAAAQGGTVMVTNVTTSPTGGLVGWPDAMYVGEVIPPDEGGICHAHERFGKPWTPPWEVRNPC